MPNAVIINSIARDGILYHNFPAFLACPMQEHHKRDPPLALFSIMVRGATAAAVVAVFVGMAAYIA